MRVRMVRSGAPQRRIYAVRILAMLTDATHFSRCTVTGYQEDVTDG
jgi:hypothetical protein